MKKYLSLVVLVAFAITPIIFVQAESRSGREGLRERLEEKRQELEARREDATLRREELHNIRQQDAAERLGLFLKNKSQVFDLRHEHAQRIAERMNTLVEKSQNILDKLHERTESLDTADTSTVTEHLDAAQESLDTAASLITELEDLINSSFSAAKESLEQENTETATPFAVNELLRVKKLELQPAVREKLTEIRTALRSSKDSLVQAHQTLQELTSNN